MVYSKLLDELNDDWYIDKKVLYLLYRVCQESMYDVRVEYLCDDIELHRKIYYGYKDIDKDEDNRVVCNTAVRLLQDLLKRININSEIVNSSVNDKDLEKNQFPDVALIYQDENGDYKYVNPVADIANCKLDMLPAFLGLGHKSVKRYCIDKDICKIENKELKKIATELGFCKLDGWPNFMRQLKEEIKSTNSFYSFLKKASLINDKEISPFEIIERKMDFISEFVPCRMKDVGPSEIQKFYIWMLWGHVFDSFERKSLVKMEKYYKRVGDEVDVNTVVHVTDNNGRNIYYMFSPDLGTFEKIEKLEEFLKRIEGYKLYNKSRKPDISRCC